METAVSSVNVYVGSEVRRDADGDAAVACFETPRPVKLRTLFGAEIDTSIVAAQGDPVKAATEFYGAVAGMDVHAAVHGMGLNAAVAGKKIGRAAQVLGLYRAIGCVDVAADGFRDAQFDAHRALGEIQEVYPVRDVQGDADAVAAADLIVDPHA